MTLIPRVWVVVTWDDGIPLVRDYRDERSAREIYTISLDIREHAYLYVTDESGQMRLILES